MEDRLKERDWLTKKQALALRLGIFLLLAVLSVYWALVDQQSAYFGDDMGFHLSRIEGLARSIQQGEWFPKINYFITGGMGYPTGIFYPDTFLYPAALLRVLGLTLIHSYIIYVIGLTFCTFVIAYYCFYAIRKQKSSAFLFSIVYGLSSYRLTDVLFRAALGEILAFMLFPLIVLGGYQLVFGEGKKWYMLMLAMTAMFFAHMLSTVISCLFLLVFCLINARQLLKEQQRIWGIVKAAVGTVLLTMAGWAPMLEQLMFQRLRVQDEPVFFLQETSESFLGYFKIALQNTYFNNIGIWSFIILILGLVCYRKLNQLSRQFLGIAVLFFFMATNLFPHSWFHNTVFNMLQFPWRYFIVVTFCLSWVAADGLLALMQSSRLRWIYMIVLSVGMLTSAIHGQFQLDRLVDRQVSYSQFLKLTGENETGFGSEFLPADMESWMQSTSLGAEPNDKIQITDISREGNRFSVSFSASEPTRLIFPVLHYKGYKIEGQGEIGDLHDAGNYGKENMHGFLEVTVNGVGNLTLWYAGTWIQYLSTGVSFLTFLLLLVFSIKKGEFKRNNNTKKDNDLSTNNIR